MIAIMEIWKSLRAIVLLFLCLFMPHFILRQNKNLLVKFRPFALVISVEPTIILSCLYQVTHFWYLYISTSNFARVYIYMGLCLTVTLDIHTLCSVITDSKEIDITSPSMEAFIINLRTKNRKQIYDVDVLSRQTTFDKMTPMQQGWSIWRS